MKKREKILVGLMVVAIMFGMANVLMRKTSAKTAQADPAQAAAHASRFVAEHRLKLSEVRPGPDTQNAAIGITASWSANPFAKRTDAAAPKREDVLELVYTGFLNLEGKTLALINGRPCQSNDVLPGSPYRVRHISPEQVVLDVGDSDQTVTVKLRSESKGEELQ